MRVWNHVNVCAGRREGGGEKEEEEGGRGGVQPEG